MGACPLQSLTTKSSLSADQARLVDLLQVTNYGYIERLKFHDGEPVFEPPPRIIEKRKMGCDNGPRPEAGLTDFWLKRQIIELLDLISDIGDGELLTIEVRGGLPFLVELERPVPAAAKRHHDV